MANGYTYQPITLDDLEPIHSADALREELSFNLENDYAPSEGGLFDQALIGIGQGIAGLPGQLGGIASFFGARDTGRRLSDYSRANVEEYEELGNALGQDEYAQMTRQFSGAVAQQAPALAAGIASRGSKPVMAAVSGLQSLGGIQDEATRMYVARGFDYDTAVEKARVPAAIGGAITGALTQLMPGGVEALTRGIFTGELSRGTAWQVLKRAVGEAVKEWPEEAVDEFAQGVLAQMTYDPDRPWGEIITEALFAGGMGFAMGAGMAPLQLLGRSGEQPAPPPRQTPPSVPPMEEEPEQMVGMRMLLPFPEAEPEPEEPSQAAPTYTPINENFEPIEEPSLPPPIDPADEELGVSMLRDILGEEAPIEQPIEEPPTIDGNAERRKFIVAQKILTAAGFDPTFAQSFADQFIAARGAEFSSTGEDFRAALLNEVDARGASPEDSASLYREDVESYIAMGFSPEDAQANVENAKIANEAKRAEVRARNEQALKVPPSAGPSGTGAVASSASTAPQTTVDAVSEAVSKHPKDVLRSAFELYQNDRFKQPPKHVGPEFALFLKELNRGNEKAVAAVSKAASTPEQSAAAPSPVSKPAVYSDAEKEAKWQEMLAEMEEKKKIRKDFSKSIVENFSGGLEFETSFGRLMLTPNIDQAEGKFRITTFDYKGDPWGHSVYNTLEEAANDLAIRGAKPQDLPKALEQARTVKTTAYDWEASTPVEGVKIRGEYDIIDAADLLTSFNQGFDQNLQPRDRTRAASTNQIISIAQNIDPARLAESPTTDMGSPIIDELNQVLSGNGRTEGLRRAYDTGKAEHYKKFLIDNAGKYGVDQTRVASMKAPILVRRIGDFGGIDKAEFARQSNKQQILGLGESEAAAADARIISDTPGLLDLFTPSQEGDILAVSNRDFLNRFIQLTGDQATLLSKGDYNKPVLRKRVQNAILSAVLGPESRRTVSDLIERSEDLGITKVRNAVSVMAPRLMRLKVKNPEYDIGPMLSEAISELVSAKEAGLKVEDYFEKTMFGDANRNAIRDMIVRKLWESPSQKAVVEFLEEYERLAGAIDTKTVDMFGEPPAPRSTLLERANENTKKFEPQTNLFEGESGAAAKKSKSGSRPAGEGSQERGSLGNQGQGDSASAGANARGDRAAQGVSIEYNGQTYNVLDWESLPKELKRSLAIALGDHEWRANRGAQAAEGISEIRTLIDRSNLSEDTKFVAQKILDVALKTGLDSAGIKVELMSGLPGGRAGSILGTVIRMLESADATVLPHEIAHLLIQLLPEPVLQQIEQARIDALPDNAPPEIVAGAMTTQQFIDSKLPRDYYPFINTDEFLANLFGTRFAKETLEARDASLLQSIANWLKELWNAIRSKFQAPDAMDRLYRDLVAGKYRVTPETSLKADQERATFVTTARDAENAAAMASTPEEEIIEGEDLIAQADALVRFLEGRGVQNLPRKARVALDYENLKGIQQAGERLTGQPDTYQNIRQRSDPSHNDRRAGMAAQHALRFQSTLNDVVDDGREAAAELNSTPMQNRMKKLQARFISALFHEQAFKDAQAAVQTGLNQAYEILKREQKNDLKIAQLQGQIKMLREIAQSRVAMNQLLDDMVNVLMSTPEGRAALQGNATARDMVTIYRDIKRSTGQTITNDQLLGVASFMLNRMPDLRDQLIAAHLSKNTATMAQAQSALMALVDRLKKEPAKTLEKIMREREKRAANATGAEFLFFHLQKELSKDLEALYLRMQQGQVAESILSDPQWLTYRDQVLKDQGSYGGKPVDPFQSSDEILVLPSGRVVSIGTNRIVDSTAETKKAVAEFAGAIDELQQWLDDPANLDDVSYKRRELDLETMETYYNLFLMQSGQRAPAMVWAASILNYAVDNSGSRFAPAVKAAIGRLDVLNDKVSQWLRPATLKLAKTQRAAMKSHGYAKLDAARAAKAYDADVFQELANLHQRQQGGPAVGDRLMSGAIVTREDLAHLEAMSKTGKELIEIVKKYDRYVLEDERGLPNGVSNYRTELTGSKFILPRQPRFELAQSDIVKTTAEAFTTYSQDPNPQTEQALSDSFARLWDGIGKFFISERNPEFARATVFDGPQTGAFKRLADEIRMNPAAYPTFDSAVARLSQFGNLSEAQTRTILLTEFGRIVNQWYQATAPEVENGKVVGGDPTNAFTRARGAQLAPSPFYRTGWSSSDDIRAHGAAATSVALNRISDGLRAIQNDINGQIEALKARSKELRARGVADAEEAALEAKRIEQHNGKAYSDWTRLESRLTQVTNAINRLTNAPIERTDWDRTWSRATGAVVGSLIGNSITTLRNTSPIYMVRALRKAGYGELQSWLLGFRYSQAQAAKIIGSGLWAIPKSALAAVKGFVQGVPAGLRDKSLAEFWRVMMRGVIDELGTNTAERISAYREMKAAGIYRVPDAQAEFDARMADMINRGEIPREKMTGVQKGITAVTALFENTVGAVANAIFPTIGDVGINTAMWELEHSRHGHSAVFGRKIKAVLENWQATPYRTFDFAKPNSPENALSHEELGITASQISNLRKYFTTLGSSFDAMAVEYMARLQADPNAEFLNADQKKQLVEALMNTANRAAVGNKPMAFKNWPKLEIFLAPLLNWPIRQLAEWNSTLSIPIEGQPPVNSIEEAKRARFAAWGQSMLLVVLGMAIPGALSQLRDEEIARLMRYFLYKQMSQNKQPWEVLMHDGAGDFAGTWARMSMESVPLLAIGANLMIPQNTPARAAYEPSLVLLEKMKDVNNAASRAFKTGDVAAPAIETLGGFMQDAKIVTSRLDSQSGLRARGNAIAMLKRFAPKELVRPREQRVGVNPNLTELSPFGPRLWNAAFNGDREKFMATYREAVTISKELGKKEPEKSVQQLFLSGNPVTSALKERLTPAQRQDMLNKMSETQRSQFLAAEKDFADAANWIGVSAPTLVKPEAKPRSATGSTGDRPLLRYEDSIRLRDAQVQ